MSIFRNSKKGHVLNWINAQTIAKLLGSESFDDWPGGKVVLYDDPTVPIAGKVVGGIRVRAVRERPGVPPKLAPQAEPPTPAPQAEAEPDFDDAWPEDDETGEEAPREVG